MSSDKLFVVAVDFGTTYSGYAFSTISAKDQIYTYSWQQGISHAAKTPTSILFTPMREFDSFGYDAEEKYAELSQQGKNKDWFFFKRFKLTLYKNSKLDERTTIRDYTDKEMPAINVFSGGIRFLKEHLIRNFQERISLLRDEDIHWVLTVPAIWDEAAKKFMRKAAEKAGIPAENLSLALEPESAALHCQSGVEQTGLLPAKPGEKFLLLDCGGGTIDVTVHEVRPDKSFKEIHKASGGPWGGIKVDDAFHEYLWELFGFEAIKALPKSDVIELDRSFELLKKKVGTTNNTHFMQIPLALRVAAPPGALVAGKLKLDDTIVKGFFDKPVESICKHIEKIVSSLRLSGLKTIILVGGFSESVLLQNKIQHNFPTMNVFTPIEPGSAVVKGAVAFGHCPEKIRLRMSPYTYGVDCIVPFRYDIHPEQKLFVFNGKEYCDDIFDVHVKVNQQVETGTPISNQNYSPLDPVVTQMSFQVVASESPNPMFITDRNCKIIGSFYVKVPRTAFKPSVNVKMIFGGTELIVEARDNITKELCSTMFEFN